jgi:predicted nucleic acid-binding protein
MAKDHPAMTAAKPCVVDTDVMVDFLRGHPTAVALVKKHTSRIVLSTIVAAELYAGIKGDAELDALDNLMALFRVIPVSLEIARIGGLYKRDFTNSHGVGLADAIIAATAASEGAELKTLNTKHYPMFKSLKPAYRKAS